MKCVHIIERRRAKALGMLRYFTGKPCKYGHFDERRTSIGHCVTCLRLLHATPEVKQARIDRYYENQPKILAEQKAYRERLPPGVLKQRKDADYEKNSKAYIARVRKWREADPERSKKLNRAVYLKNHERNKARNRAWRKANVEKEAALKASKRAAVRKATPTWGRELTLFVHEEALKLARVREQLFGFAWHVDHMVPLKGRGFIGLHIWYNLQLLPAALNLYKGNKLMFTEPFEWMSSQ